MAAGDCFGRRFPSHMTVFGQSTRVQGWLGPTMVVQMCCPDFGPRDALNLRTGMTMEDQVRTGVRLLPGIDTAALSAPEQIQRTVNNPIEAELPRHEQTVSEAEEAWRNEGNPN